MTITVPDNFKGIFHCDQKFAVKPLEIVGNFISQDIKPAMGQSTFEYAAAKEWNDLPKELRACKTLGLFKIRTFKFLIELDKTQHTCSV